MAGWRLGSETNRAPSKHKRQRTKQVRGTGIETSPQSFMTETLEPDKGSLKARRIVTRPRIPIRLLAECRFV